MTETFLALIPTYGVWLILVSVTMSCLALPVPSSIMVMVAGGFAAAGDFAFWQLVFFAYAGFILGDQLAFWLARRAGGPLIRRFEQKPSTAAVVGRAKSLVERRGLVAVFLSRTVLSPLGPYVGYISGALGMAWLGFSATAVVGAFLWCFSYAWLGFTFADQITQIASLISSSVGIVLAGAVAVGGLSVLVRNYRRAQREG
jgi:membrane-associated protein